MDFYEENNFLPNGAKAKKLRVASERYELSEELLEEIMNEDTESTSSSKAKNTFYDRLREEFYPGLYDSDIEEVLWELAEEHRHRSLMEEYWSVNGYLRNQRFSLGKHRIRISIRIPDGRLTPTIYLGANAPKTPNTGALRAS